MALRTVGTTLGRMLPEAIAIFVGVAAALAGQAWFEGRTERIAEREFLQGVLAELVTIEDATSVTNRSIEGRRLIAVRLANLLSEIPNAPRADSIANLASQISWYSRATGYEAVDLLLGPEGLRLVRDAALRSRLAEFRLAVANVRLYLGQNRDFVLTEWRAFAMGHIRLMGEYWGDQPDALPISRHNWDGAQLADSPEFENLIAIAIAQYRAILREASDIAGVIPDLRGSINERLAAL